MESDRRLRTADILPPAGLCLVLLLCYLAAAQPIPTYDTRFFLFSYSTFHHPIHPHHPLFGYVLAPFLVAGRAAGLSLMTAGMLHSAVFAALSAVAFHGYLRRHNLSRATALLFAALLGLNASVIDIATTTELYAVCLFVVVLSLRAFDSVVRREAGDWRLEAGGWRLEEERKRSDSQSCGLQTTDCGLRTTDYGLQPTACILLWLCCFALFALHVGFAFWVMALYLALAWRGRRRPLRALGWILQAAAIPVLALLWLYLAGSLESSQASVTGTFVERFWMRGEAGVFRRIAAAPLYQFAMYAGFLLFPAWVGWRWFRSRLPDLATAGWLATVLFFLFYSFWVTDRGVFYLPLQPVWGLFAALAFQEFASKGTGRPLLLVCGALAYGIPFMLLPALPTLSSTGPLSWVLAFSYLLFCVAAYLLAGRPIRRGEGPGAAAPAPKVLVAFACLALLISVAAYLPYIIQKHKPDTLTLFYRAVQANTPRSARYVTLFSETEGLRPAVQTERQCLIVNPRDWDAAKARQLTRWLAESAQPGGAPVFFSYDAYAWRKEIFSELKPTIETPLSDWSFSPISLTGENTGNFPKGIATIYRVQRNAP